MAMSLVQMNALKNAEMVKTMEGLSVMMETWMIMMVVTVNDTLKSDISVQEEVQATQTHVVNSSSMPQ